MNVYFELPQALHAREKSRLSYAFRLFCAIYGHRAIINAAAAAQSDVCIRYTGHAASTGVRNLPTVWLRRSRCDRDPHQPAPPPVRYVRDELDTVLHDTPEEGSNPDWLCEIFEWVSCADEYSVTRRDRLGRPSFAATYFGRHALDVRTPYAAVAMRALQLEICRVVPCAGMLPQPPAEGCDHVVIPTHDVDYFPLGRMHAVRRLSRNGLLSLLRNRWSLAAHQAGAALDVALGTDDDPLDQLMAVADEEQRLGFRSSYYFMVRNAHRRDARYTLDDRGVVETMAALATRGMEIGLHSSFTSLDSFHGVEDEAAALRARGFRVIGNRQHWLRFTLDRLIPAVERAGLEYDTSVGWSTRIGFRAGACFAFPPYDFESEGPADFLEFPLISMDQAFHSMPGGEAQLFHEAARMIATSRRFGWGGVSLLWHPAAFGAGWLPAHVGEIYWRLAKDRARSNDTWMNGAEFLSTIRNRFVEAGLLSPAGASRVVEMAAGPHRASSCGSSASGRMHDSGPWPDQQSRTA